MATQFDSMIQNAQFRNPATGVSVSRKSAIPKVPNKPVRKPLGEISNSNSLKPPQNHVTHNPGDDKGVHKSTMPLNRNKNLTKTATPATRKPLGDISNSRKPALPHTSQKTKVKNTNASELGDPGIDKGFLHNHGECIKSARQSVDIDYFLETIGLCKDSSLKNTISLHSVAEEEMDLKREMPELLPEESSPLSSKPELAHSLQKSPVSKFVLAMGH